MSTYNLSRIVGYGAMLVLMILVGSVASLDLTLVIGLLLVIATLANYVEGREFDNR